MTKKEKIHLKVALLFLVASLTLVFTVINAAGLS